MHIDHLRLENFRNLLSQEIYFSPQINLIHGDNGSGKTSLLEAIYYLGRVKSFRTSRYKELTQYSKDYFRIIAKISHENRKHHVGLERNHDKSLRIRLDRVTQKSPATLAKMIPLSAMTANSFSLIDSSPIYRRQFMDYGSFHRDERFYRAWLTYQKSLKNRNAGLKQKLPKAVIDSFTPQLSAAGELLHQIRGDYMTDLNKRLQHHLERLDFPHPIKIKYQSGYGYDLTLIESLEKHYAYDLRMNHTRYGPHRADIQLSTEQGGAAAYLSRGQQKIFIIAIYLAQIDLIFESSQKSPLLIIDDIGAELDHNRLMGMLEYLTKLNCQVFLSATANNFLSSNLRDLSTQVQLKAGKIITSQ